MTFATGKGDLVHVEALEQAGSASWHATDRSPWHQFEALGVWTERRPARGEDAEPLFVHHRPSDEGVLAVFDGAGGAGSAIEGSSDGAVDRTGAWVGSRVARAATEEWFVRAGAQGVALDAAGLKEALVARLDDMHTKRRRKISGSMRRELPTTLAAVSYRLEPDRVRWQAMWAGDSRCYAMTHSAGLQQLSMDDTESSDALELLTSDPPMTNLISADGRFEINQHHGELPVPCVLLAATDGFFGYVTTPAEFEYVLLDTLSRSRSFSDWGTQLVAAVEGYTGDDASLSALAVGFDDFAQLRAAFAARLRQIDEEHWRPMRAALTEGREATVSARADSWLRYRGGYEHRMPRRDEQGDER